MKKHSSKKVKQPNKNIHKKADFYQHSRGFFHGYPKTEILNSKEIVFQSIKDRLAHLKAKIKYLLVAYETGKEERDGKNYEHFHVVIKFDRQVNVYSKDFWDLEGVHGNYQTISRGTRSWHDVTSYCKKDKDFLEEIDRSIECEAAMIKGDASSTLLAHFVEKLKGKDLSKGLKSEIQAIVKEMSLDTECVYRLNSKKIMEALKEALNDRSQVMNVVNFINYDRCSFVNVPKGIEDWEKEAKHEKSLILTGRSGIGKSGLALSMFKNPLIVSIKEDLKDLNDEHDGIVFDDFAFNRLKETEKIHVLDLEKTKPLEVKFGSIQIIARLPRVFTTNDDIAEFYGYKSIEDVPYQLTRRAKHFYIVDDLRPEGSED